MISKTLLLIGLFSGNVMARLNEDIPVEVNKEHLEEHLDLELIVEGKRQMFPLLPGTKCPPGHTCRIRNVHNPTGMSPMVTSLKNNLKTPLAMAMDWSELNKDLTTVVNSNDRCSRRNAMAKAAGMLAGLSVTTVNAPAYAAETVEVKMGADNGGLQFVPAATKICKGDSVKWINNKGGPHNVVFDEEAVPAGVDAEKLSMDEQLGEEGDTFTMSFTTAGDYEYYCEPHRGAGMNAKLTVT